MEINLEINCGYISEWSLMVRGKRVEKVGRIVTSTKKESNLRAKKSILFLFE